MASIKLTNVKKIYDGGVVAVQDFNLDIADKECSACNHTCADRNTDHKCDDCGNKLSDCADAAADGDHNCDICGAVNITKHTYGEDKVCTDCGVKLEVRINTRTLALEAEIEAVFYMTIPEHLLNDDNAYATLTLVGTPRNKKVMMSEIRETYNASNGRCSVTMGVPAMYMTKTVELRFFDSSDVQANLITNTWSGDAYAYVPKDYITNNVNKAGVAASLKHLLAAMATYIGYAQDYFAPNDATVDKDPLYNVLEELGSAPVDISGVTKESVGRANDHGNDPDKNGPIGIHLRSFSIALEAAIDLSLVFSVDDGYSIDDFTIMLSREVFIDNQSVIETIPLTAEYVESSGRYLLKVEGIAAAHWDYEYKITITNNKNGETNVWGSSVLAYLANQMTDTKPVALQNLVKAMYVYNQAANAHLGF